LISYFIAITGYYLSTSNNALEWEYKRVGGSLSRFSQSEQPVECFSFLITTQYMPAVQSANHVEPTPLPYFRVVLLGLILAANNTSIWMIFSFLPFMVQHFFPDLPVTQLGYEAGLLGSAFSAGSLIGNVVWGVVSDRAGRRPTLLSGLLGTGKSRNFSRKFSNYYTNQLFLLLHLDLHRPFIGPSLHGLCGDY